MPTTTNDQPIPFAVWRLAAVIVFGAFMSGLDASVVNVGLDSISRELHTNLATAQWATNGYLVALGVSLPACGWLGRRVGVGRLWLAALAAFTLASALCALAPSIGWLIALRVLQGISAGLLIPAGQTILGQAVGPGRLGRVMSILGVAVTAAPAIGPILGGIVVSVATWPWLFLLNVPIGIAGLALGWRYIPRGTPENVGALDRRGLAMLTIGLPLAVYGATAWGERQTLADARVVVPLLAGLGTLAAYVRHSKHAPRPVLDLTLFRNDRYAAATVTAGFTGAALFGAGLLFPLYFQIGRGQGTIQTGLLLISLSIGTIVILPCSGRLVDRYGGGPVSVAGGVLSVLTTIPFVVLDTRAPGLAIQALLLARGAAIALAVVPAGTAAYKAVSVAQLPDATTQVNILQRLGGALGGAIFAVVLATRLPQGTTGAFHAAFACLTAASVLGLGAAAWLTRAEQQARRTDTHLDTAGHPSPA